VRRVGGSAARRLGDSATRLLGYSATRLLGYSAPAAVCLSPLRPEVSLLAMSANQPSSLTATQADASFRAAVRLLASLMPDAAIATGSEPPLESLAQSSEPPRTVDATIIEDGMMRSHRVFEPPIAQFAAFLDGTQLSRMLHCCADGTPIIHGTAAAVIRERRNKRLYTRRHIVARRLYANRRRVPDSLWTSLAESGISLRDTADEEGGQGPHPFASRDAAIHRLQRDREDAERDLAKEWCEREDRPLLIDGGISGMESVARSSCAVGVIKSHRTLYAERDALVTTFALKHGERSSVFRVEFERRTPVASWYLRLRDRAGTDPMWGLVRVEVAHPDRVDERAIGARADEVSRWILAEATPVSLPDGRWDKMVYGVRDCEEFLRAVI